MPNEPSWDDIFRSDEGDAARPAQPSSVEPEALGLRVRASDPYAVAAAEAQRRSAAGVDDPPPSRRELREQAPRARAATEPRVRDARPRRRFGWLIAVIVVIALLAAGAGAVWILFEDRVRDALGWELPTDYTGTGNGTEVVVVIPSGAIGEDVARLLADEGVTMTFDAGYDYLLAHPEVTFEPGNWRLQEQMSAASAFEALQDPANRVTNQALVIEGAPIEDAFAQIAGALDVPVEEVAAAGADPARYGVPAEAPSLEGFLFPATYQFDPGTTPDQAIQRMVDEMFERLDALGVAPGDRLRVLTLASIVQRESGPNVEDMYKIARVFQNRLDQGMRLQSDATVAYGTGNTHTVWTTDAERADASNRYNTYANEGLPIGPIGLPGETAIDAALHPADGPWLYFVPINLKTGETVFSTTAEEHEKAAARLRAWCRESAENATYCE